MAMAMLIVFVTLGLGNLVLGYFGIDSEARKGKLVRTALCTTATLTIGGPIFQYWANARSDRAVVAVVTGGESFAYVAPQDHSGDTVQLVVWNHGDYALNGVTVVPWSQNMGEAPAPFEPEIVVGTLGPGDMRWISKAIVPVVDEKQGFAHYILNISAQNGTVQEVINVRPGKDGRRWATRFSVTRQCPVEGEPNTFTGCMLLDRSQWSDGSVDVPPDAGQAKTP